MMANYARVVKRSAALTAVVAAIMVGVSAPIAGGKGVFGALIGAGIVTVFFGISVVVVGRAARVSPQVMMAAALASYVVKIIAFMVVLIVLQKSTGFSDRTLGFTALACILTWSVAQVVTAVRLKLPYVDTSLEHKA
jgi:ATP synthase protein I